MVGIFKFYSLGEFQVSNTAFTTVTTLFFRSPEFIHLITFQTAGAGWTEARGRTHRVVLQTVRGHVMTLTEVISAGAITCVFRQVIFNDHYVIIGETISYFKFV